MKKTYLIFSLVGALAPYALYYLLLFLGFPQSSPPDAPYGAAAVVILLAVILLTDAALLYTLWHNPKLQGKQWMLTALTLAFTPACSLPLYFYFSLGEE